MASFEVPRLLKITLACIGVGFLIGVAIGKYLNRSWNSSDKTYLYIHNTMHFTLVEQDDPLVTASCGVDSFLYFARNDSLAVVSVSSGTLSQMGMNRGDISDIAAIVMLLGIPTTGVTVASVGKDVYKFMSEVTTGEKAVIVATSIIAFGSGVGIGIWLTYDAKPPYDNQVVKATYNDKKTWKKLAQSVRAIPRGIVLPKGVIVGKPIRVQ